MYIYRLRQKSTGLFFATSAPIGLPMFNADGRLFRDKGAAQWALSDIKKHRQSLSCLYHNYADKTYAIKSKAEYAKEARALRPGNFELVVYFCKEQETQTIKSLI